MHSNHVYNLMNQLVQEHKSLWRIKNDYMKDSKDCPECTTLWKKLEKEKEATIDELTTNLKKCME